MVDMYEDVDVDLEVLACFSERSTVQVEGKGLLSMKDLQVGDKVLTDDNSTRAYMRSRTGTTRH
jgi:hypothetical protein